MDCSKIKVGDRLVLMSGGWNSNTYLATIERLTKTQVITQRGERFRRQGGFRVGDGSGYILKVATEEDIKKIVIRNRISTLTSKLSALTYVNSTDLLKNLDRILEVATELKSLKI